MFHTILLTPFLLAMVVVIVYFLKKRNIIVLSVKKPESPTVSFENPFYTVRDQANVIQVNTKYKTRLQNPVLTKLFDFLTGLY